MEQAVHCNLYTQIQILKRKRELFAFSTCVWELSTRRSTRLIILKTWFMIFDPILTWLSVLAAAQQM